MSDSDTVAADEDPGVSSQENDTDVLNNSDADTEPAMIEEEEMPTYLSLTCSSKPDESRTDLDKGSHEECSEEVQRQTDDNSQTVEEKENRASSPYTSDDQAGRPVYVVSSGEESDRAYDDEDYDSDEMDMEDEMEEEEEDDDDSRHGLNDDGEDSDGDIEPEQFERSSDDFLLRYDTSLEKHPKARSRSLQDLTQSRGNLSRFVGKRRSVDIMGNDDDEEIAAPPRDSLRDPLGELKKSSRSSRYANVPSKVKLYIQSIKEESRRSAELKNLENPLHRNFNDIRGGKSEVSCTRINPVNKVIKGYAQNFINEIIEEQDNTEIPDVTYGGRRLGENGPEKESIIVSEAKELSDKDTELETIHDNQINNANNNIGRSRKCNGIRNTPNHVDKVVEHMETCETNGQEESDGILNLRTVSYEEYVNGEPSSNNKIKNNDILPSSTDNNNGIVIVMEEEEILGTTETEITPISLKIESVKGSDSAQTVTQIVQEITEPLKSSGHEITAKNRENADVAMLWAMLNQKSAQFNEKTAQYDGIRDAFQKTLAENISLKRELDDLKKMLEHCRTEHKPRETNVAAVQTDNFTELEEMKILDDSKISNNDLKPPGQTIFSSSIASGMSSIEHQWSDSNCSPAISINPPNMDHVLNMNSDDSLIVPERTPKRQTKPISHSFITSSRILQTLANITQGRTKTASPVGSSARTVNPRMETEQGQSKQEINNPLASGNEKNSTRTRKRKASDMLGFMGDAKSFKIPFTSDVPRKKNNSDFHTDGVYKTSREQLRTGYIKEPTPGRSKDTENTDKLTDDHDDTGATEVPENVKCFVYQEEADSKERSFLIQAEDSPNSSDVGPKRGGTARECGPYLLGNVEIRMSEANGTINIWGKEINQESEYVDVEDEEKEYEEDEVEVEVEAMDESEFLENPLLSRRSSFDGQKTPRAKCIHVASPFVCSTNKKPKLSSLNMRSSIGKYFRPVSSNSTRLNTIISEGTAGRYASSPTLDNRRTDCEQCEPQTKRRTEWPSYDHLTNSRQKHNSCCRPEMEVNEKEYICDCARDRGVFDDDAILQAMTNILSSHKKCTAMPHNSSTKRSCSNHVTEDNYKHENPHYRQSNDEDSHEADCHQAKKRCSSCTGDLSSCNTRLIPGKAGCSDNRSRSHSHGSSCDDDGHPLLHNGHSETPETKRRRLSGKKVRGILTDLLRGCGGCRNDTSVSFLTKESVTTPHVIPAVRVTPCTPQRLSTSKPSTACASHSKHAEPSNSNNDKCCSSCSRRVEMAAEIESALELLTVKMERLRSHSDTFRGMLNLLTADTD